MAGVLLIVYIPKKHYEIKLKLEEIEKDKIKDTANIINELKENKKFASIQLSIESYGQNNENALSKCISTDCLHTNSLNPNQIPIYKSKSENTLEIGGNAYMVEESKSYIKSSWEEVKQIIKPNKYKLKITEPGRGSILSALHKDTDLETVLEEVIARLHIKNASWNSTRDNNFWQITFSLESSTLCEELLQVLQTFGIGSRHESSVSVIPCALYYKSNYDQHTQILEDKERDQIQRDTKSAWSRFYLSVRARNNLAQVLQDVKTDAALTFDWIFLLIVAAFVAAIGLVENSTVILVASMLISPLMGPITAGTLGTAVRDSSLQHMGVMHEMLGLLLSLVIGFIFGLTICAVDERYGVGEWPTYEMMSRCEIRSLWIGVLVAIPSGAGVALAVLGEYTASLVGVAISASLLPPAVNAGLLWALALVHLIFIDDNTRWTGVVKTSLYSNNQATELAVLGTVSLCLTLVNIVCIFLAGVAVYKVKEVCPFERRDISWWRSNKSFLHRRQKTKEESFNPWDIYSKWHNQVFEPLETSKASSCNGTENNKLFREDNIKEMDFDWSNDRDMVTKTENFEYRKSETSQIEPSSTHEINKEQINNVTSLNLNVDTSISKSENDLRHEDYDSNSSHYPVIEPSSNFTVNSKKYGVLLSNKTFDV